MAEPFDIKKWASGFINPVTWSKSIVYFGMVLLILFVGLTIYRAFFMKTGSNIHRPWMIALPGSTVTADMSSEQKVEQKKRSWWMPIPYIEVFGEITSKYDEDNKFTKPRPGFGVETGVRWDFG